MNVSRGGDDDDDDQHLSNKPPTARKRSRYDLDHTTKNNNSKKKAVRTPPSRKRQPKFDGNVQKLAMAAKGWKKRGSQNISKMGSTSDINNSTIKGNKEIGNLLKISDSSDSEIYEHEERIYELLKSCTYKVKGKKGQFRCPFCSVEEEREYDYLLRHALTVEGSSESAKQRANHFALAKYLVTDLPAEFETIEDLVHKRCRLEDEKKEKALKTLWKENEELKRSNADLLAKERRIRDELQRAQKELAKGLNVWQSGKNGSIGIKKKGEIDVIPFKKASKKRFSKREAHYVAVDTCYVWQEQIKNHIWHPFRFVGDEKGNLERLLNNDDEQLRALKQDWGDEVYNAVIIALKDLNEYSPRKRRTVPEIWNFSKNRVAKMEEVISFVFAELLAQKQQLEKTGKTATLIIKS